MDGLEFRRKIAEDPRFSWFGCCQDGGDDEGCVLILHVPSRRKWEVGIRAILDNSWEDLAAVLAGEREAMIMDQMTRITGYYSLVKGWNRSKRRELQDRHRGDYALTEAQE